MNRFRNPAKQYLEKNKAKFPRFELTKDVIYNGINVLVDDDDYEEFIETVESYGFQCEADDEPEDQDAPQYKYSPKMPKFKLR